MTKAFITFSDILKKIGAHGVDANIPDEKINIPQTSPKVMTPYDVLGVPTSAKADDITVAYRSLLKKHHPDTGDGDTAQLQRVRDAFSLIGNAQKRERYDKAVKLLQKQEQVDVEWTPVQYSSRSSRFGFYSSGSINPNSPPASYGIYTTGSGYPQAGQQRTGLRVGYQIPQIGGVVGRITRAFAQGSPSISSRIMYLIVIYATFPQWVVRDWKQWENSLSNSLWWLDALSLDHFSYAVGKIDIVVIQPALPIYQLGTLQPIGQVNSLGAQIELEVIET